MSGVLLRALESGQGASVLGSDAWTAAEAAFGARWRDAVGDLLRQSARETLASLDVPISFDLDNPYAQAWAKDQSATMVQATRETRDAIREVMGRAFVEQLPPRVSARLIVPLIGLDSRSARAVENMRASMEEDGASDERVLAATERYGDRLLRQRALLIARTETLDAENAGTDAAWKTARDAGYVQPSAVRVWSAAAGSERTCRICLDLHGEEAPLDGAFASSFLGSVDRPPAHPACRCSLSLRTPRPE